MPRQEFKPFSQPQETHTAILTIAVWKYINNGVEFVFGYHENPLFKGKIQVAKIYTDKAPKSANPMGAVEEALINLRLAHSISRISRISLIEDSTACNYYAVEFKLSHEIIQSISVDI